MINIFPDSNKDITCIKKRTLMQPQRNKGNKLDCSAKDFIFTDLTIAEGSIIMANGEKVEK